MTSSKPMMTRINPLAARLVAWVARVNQPATHPKPRMAQREVLTADGMGAGR